jgi:DNA-binding transcriptional MerR regulator
MRFPASTGPAHSTIRRNDEALELWEMHKPKPKAGARKSDPTLSYSRAELIAHLRCETGSIADLKERLQAEIQAHAAASAHNQNVLGDQLVKEEQIAELEAKLAKYDQYLAGLRDSLKDAEHG